MASGVTEQHRHNVKKHVIKVLSEMLPKNKVPYMIKFAESIESKAYNGAQDMTKYQSLIQTQLETFRQKFHQMQTNQSMNGHVAHPMQNAQAFPPGANQAHSQPNPHVGMQQTHQQMRYPGYPTPMPAAPAAPQGGSEAEFFSFMNDVGLLPMRQNEDKQPAHGQQHDMMAEKQMAVTALQNANAAATYRGQMPQGAMMQQQQPGMMPGPGSAAASMYLPQGMQARTAGVPAHGLMGLQPQQPMPYSIPPGLPPVRMTNPAAQQPQLPNAHQMLNPGLAGVHQPGMTPAQQQQQQQQINAIAAQNAIAQQQQNNAAVAAMNNVAKNNSMMGMPMNAGMQGGFSQPASQMQQFHMQQQGQQQAVQQNAAVQSGRVGQQMQAVPQTAGPGNMIPLNALNAPNMAAPRPQHPAQINNPAQPMPNMPAQSVANSNQPMPASNNPAGAQGLPVPNNQADRERLLPTFKMLIERGDALYTETLRLVNHHLETSRRQAQTHPNNANLAQRLSRLEQAHRILQHFSKVSTEFKAGNATISNKTTYQLSHVVKNVESLSKQLTGAPAAAAAPTPPAQQADTPKPPAAANLAPTPAQAPTPGTAENQERGEVIDLTDRHDNAAAAAAHAAAANPTPNTLPANANSPAVLAAPSPHAASPIPLSQTAAPRPAIPRAPESHTPANANFPLPPKASSVSAVPPALSMQVSTPAADTGGQTEAPTAAAASTPATEAAAPALDPMTLLQQQLESISAGNNPPLDAVRASQYIKAAVQQSHVVPINPSMISSQLKLDEFTSPRLHSCNIATFTVDSLKYAEEEPKQESAELPSAPVPPVVQAESEEQMQPAGGSGPWMEEPHVHPGRKRARMAAEQECSATDGQLPDGAKLSLHSPEQVDVPCAPDTAVVVEVEVVEESDKVDSEQDQSWKRLKLAVPAEYPDEPPQALFTSNQRTEGQMQYRAAVKHFQATLEEQPSLRIQDMASIWLDSVRTSCQRTALVS